MARPYAISACRAVSRRAPTAGGAVPRRSRPMRKFLSRIFGDSTDRALKSIRSQVEVINGLEPQFVKLTDEQLRAKTAEFKNRLAKGETLDDILPEEFAATREASKRT